MHRMKGFSDNSKRDASKLNISKFGTIDTSLTRQYADFDAETLLLCSLFVSVGNMLRWVASIYTYCDYAYCCRFMPLTNH